METLSAGGGSCKWGFVCKVRMERGGVGDVFCMSEALIKWAVSVPPPDISSSEGEGKPICFPAIPDRDALGQVVPESSAAPGRSDIPGSETSF